MDERAAEAGAPERGYYVYGVVAAGADVDLAEVEGVEPSSAISVLEHRKIGAIVSQVPLDQFGDEKLQENLESLPWLERTVRAHEQVLERALASAAVVPMRFGTIFRTLDPLRDLLADEHDRFAAALTRLRDKREWGVKCFVDRERLAEWVAGADEQAASLRDEIAAKGEGAAYLARKKLDRHVAGEVERISATCGQASHERLAAAAIDAGLQPPAQRDGSSDPRHLLFNGAYLVSSHAEASFQATVSSLADEYRNLGVSFELTGPWPAYNFVAREGETR